MKFRVIRQHVLVLFLIGSCPSHAFVEDPHSYADISENQVTHIDLDLVVDFDQKTISGTCGLTLHHNHPGSLLVLDTKDLTIHSIQSVYNAEEISNTVFELNESNPILGSKLDIYMRKDIDKLIISYTTSPTSKALQWLSSEQTASKIMPYLYSQAQAIHARSFIPLQDSPQIRFTYNARLKVPKGMMALMSAENPQEIAENGEYFFSMKQPIPAYLLSIAVGNIIFRPLSERCGIYAEPTIIDEALWEFSETEQMIKAAEELFGIYRWGRYDMLVMPPSFPYGGMQNPRISFISPTIISKDRSNVNVVAHELAHSWFGNLVTNATWNDFWLNEGLTVYAERRILEHLYGKTCSNIHAKLGEMLLRETFAELQDRPELTHLYLNLIDMDPDEGTSLVAYEKGFNFLRTVEDILGREKLDGFLKSYISSFAFKAITTEKFIAELKRQSQDNILPINDWVYQPNFPSNYREISCPELEKVRLMAERLEMSHEMKSWSTQQWLYYIKYFPINRAQAQLLECRFDIISKNAEIQTQWFMKLFDAEIFDQHYKEKIEEFLITVGRGKFIIPLYKKLIEKDMSDLAKDIFEKARSGYHQISVESISELFVNADK